MSSPKMILGCIALVCCTIMLKWRGLSIGHEPTSHIHIYETRQTASLFQEWKEPSVFDILKGLAH